MTKDDTSCTFNYPALGSKSNFWKTAKVISDADRDVFHLLPQEIGSSADGGCSLGISATLAANKALVKKVCCPCQICFLGDCSVRFFHTRDCPKGFLAVMSFLMIIIVHLACSSLSCEWQLRCVLQDCKYLLPFVFLTLFSLFCD